MKEIWTKKYLPKNTKEIMGQDEIVAKLKNYVSNYNKQKKRGAIIYGPVGSGKTSSVYAIAKELSSELIEVNASDVRNKEQIDLIVGNALKQQSLFFSGKIILLDEIDGLSGTGDRGGVQAVAALLENSRFPVIMTANDPYDKKFSDLRKKCEIHEFKKLGHNDVSIMLKRICANENIMCDEEAISRLAIRSGGDLRGAIIDLQTLAAGNRLTKDDVERLGERSRTESIFEFLKKIFKTTDVQVALQAADNVEEDLDELFLWIDENLPREYTGYDLIRAYEKLSRADVMKSRIRRWQHYRFLVYVSALLSAGIAVSKDKKNDKFTGYDATKRILKYWIAKQKYAKRNSIAGKIAPVLHSSKKEIIKSTLPYLKAAFKNDGDFAKRFADEFELSEDEALWMGQ